MAATPPPPSPSRPIHVAIIGGGIAGVTLALGLARRNVSFTLYERASSVREIGAGIGLSPNAERAMQLLNATQIHEAFQRVAAPNGDDHFQWIDGFETDTLMFKLHMGVNAFRGCRRSDFVEEMLKGIDSERVVLGRQAEGVREVALSSSFEEGGGAGGEIRKGVEISFADGSLAHADAVVGCDGIRSRVRQVLLGEDNPAAHAGYTGKFCYRALVPMEKARAALGHERTRTRFMYNGPGAHAITYPVGVGEDTVLNVLLVVSDPNGEWPLEETGGRHTAPGTRTEAQAAVAHFHPTFRALVDLFPEKMDKWAIFDSLEHPAPSYVDGLVCLAGDAAHATGPHLGAGAGFGIEDALVLASLLETVDGDDGGSRLSKEELLRRALKVYDEVRLERTKWLVKATREAVALFQWQDEEGFGRDGESFGREITTRFLRIWDYDIEAMVADSLGKFRLAMRA